MKTIPRLLALLSIAVCAASAHAELAPVSFLLGQQQFKAGDGIVIDQVFASSPRLKPGVQVQVRGHYRLASSAKARIGLFVTQHAPAGSDRPARTPIGPAQMTPIDAADGSFELTCEITADGEPHVSFYPIRGGESFGGVYFSAAPAKS